MLDKDELNRRFEYHKPANDATVVAHTMVRGRIRALVDVFNGLLPEGREKALVITKMEEAMFWANAAIARAGGSEDPDRGQEKGKTLMEVFEQQIRADPDYDVRNALALLGSIIGTEIPDPDAIREHMHTRQLDGIADWIKREFEPKPICGEKVRQGDGITVCMRPPGHADPHF